MLGIERKPFKSIVFIDFERSNQTVTIAEGMIIKFLLSETGEEITGQVIKVASKALLIKVKDEVGYREYQFSELESIKELIDQE